MKSENMRSVAKTEAKTEKDRQMEAPTSSCTSPFSCSVCGSELNVQYYDVGNVGVSQMLPLCGEFKPNQRPTRQIYQGSINS